MLARLYAKAIFLTIAIALVFFGVGLLGLALAKALTAHFGEPTAFALTGVVLLTPPLIAALVIILSGPARRKVESPAGRDLMNSLFSALARETPWAAVVGAGLVGAANLFLNRNKTKK